MRLYIPSIEVRRGDSIVKSYGACEVFEVYETRRGTVAICAQTPWGQHEFRHRPGTKVLVDRQQAEKVDA